MFIRYKFKGYSVPLHGTSSFNELGQVYLTYQSVYCLAAEQEEHQYQVLVAAPQPLQGNEVPAKPEQKITNILNLKSKMNISIMIQSTVGFKDIDTKFILKSLAA